MRYLDIARKGKQMKKEKSWKEKMHDMRQSQEAKQARHERKLQGRK